jgi:oligosaccharide amylase
MPQHADAIRGGLRLAGTDRTTWFDGADDGWNHRAAYVPGTNIFAVHASSPNVPIAVRTELYAVPGEDIIVFDYTFTNTGEAPASFSFYFYSSIRTAENPFYHTTRFTPEADALVHFRHDYYFSVAGANVCTKYQAGYAWEAACSGGLNGDPIQMAPDGALEWSFDDIAQGASVNLSIFLAAGRTLETSLAALQTVRSAGSHALREQTVGYWRDFVSSASPCPIDRSDIRELYERSVLTMKLMSDERTGSMIAAPEFDEHFSRCGGYAYCWGRDAAFITTALDKAGLSEISTRFYEWTLTAQDPDGAWQQRHYHDGMPAPNWGLQLDEGASILWGMFQHYEALPDGERQAFQSTVWPAVRLGADYLCRQVDPGNGLPFASRDLWEEREGQHTYTSAAVYAGLRAAAGFAGLAGRDELAERWMGVAKRIAEQIGSLCWNEERDTYYRGVMLTVDRNTFEQAEQAGLPTSRFVDGKGYSRYKLPFDPIVDVSLLGVSVPFAVVPPDHPQSQRAADAIEQALTSPGVGGIRRYENDAYIGGNPWILATLWLAQYRARNGQLEEAEKWLDWALNHRTLAGLLPEQVDRQSGDAAWVVPLTWSHAMFILTVHDLAQAYSCREEAARINAAGL